MSIGNRNWANELNRMMNTGRAVSSYAEREMIEMEAYEMQRKVMDAANEIVGTMTRKMGNMLDRHMDRIRGMYDDEW